MTMKINNLPKELKGLEHWGQWVEVRRNGKANKMPCRGFTSTNQDSWTSFKEASAGWDDFIMPAIALGSKGDSERCIVGVDLDDVRDPQTGDVTVDEAVEILETLETMDFYIEVSPSKTGFKAFGVVDNPEGLTTGFDVDCDGWAVEIYMPHKSANGRFFTVTGETYFAGSAVVDLDEFEGFTLPWKERSGSASPDRLEKVVSRKGETHRSMLSAVADELVVIDDMIVKVEVPVTVREAGEALAVAILKENPMPVSMRNQSLTVPTLKYHSHVCGLIGEQRARELYMKFYSSSPNSDDEFNRYDLPRLWDSMTRNSNPTEWTIEEIDRARATSYQYITETEDTVRHATTDDNILGIYYGDTAQEAAQALVDALSDGAEEVVKDEIDLAIEQAGSTLEEINRRQIKRTGGLGFCTIDEWNDKSSDPDVLVDGILLASSMAVMAAPDKCGKTTLALTFALNCAAGRNFLDQERWRCDRPLKTIMITAETHNSHIKILMQEIMDGLHYTDEERELVRQNLILSDYVGEHDEDVFNYELGGAIKAQGTECLIFDPLYFYTSTESIDKQVFKRQISWLHKLTKKFSTGILVIDHTNKSATKESKENYTDPEPLDQDALYGNGRQSFFRNWILMCHSQPKAKRNLHLGCLNLYVTLGGGWVRSSGGQFHLKLRTFWPEGASEEQKSQSPFNVMDIETYDSYSSKAKKESADEKQRSKEEKEAAKALARDTALKLALADIVGGAIAAGDKSIQVRHVSNALSHHESHPRVECIRKPLGQEALGWGKSSSKNSKVIKFVEDNYGDALEFGKEGQNVSVFHINDVHKLSKLFDDIVVFTAYEAEVGSERKSLSASRRESLEDAGYDVAKVEEYADEMMSIASPELFKSKYCSIRTICPEHVEAVKLWRKAAK
jgi:hypothetical protein